ncbi:hypothetical protein E4L96_19300 [Massilia arenosa]|uniref:Uncharacterized protein n=1 Tax=Zemynaea arenosa TaxID=2561931 RepID=A0A4Y9RX93_9BURK|nr:hypothetical protein [Massilia arenosa]TFW13760.1 hypothetical protein E4L96_19300 [Massilia arenosa]
MPAIRLLSLPVFALLLANTAAAAKIEPFSVFKERGGQFAAGTYSCRQQYNQAGYTYKVVEFSSPASYAWVSGGKKPGAMTYDSASGKISFSSGPLGKGFEAHFGKRADGAPVIILVDTDLAPKADAYDYCTRRAGS